MQMGLLYTVMLQLVAKSYGSSTNPKILASKPLLLFIATMIMIFLMPRQIAFYHQPEYTFISVLLNLDVPYYALILHQVDFKS